MDIISSLGSYINIINTNQKINQSSQLVPKLDGKTSELELKRAQTHKLSSTRLRQPHETTAPNRSRQWPLPYLLAVAPPPPEERSGATAGWCGADCSRSCALELDCWVANGKTASIAELQRIIRVLLQAGPRGLLLFETSSFPPPPFWNWSCCSLCAALLGKIAFSCLLGSIWLVWLEIGFYVVHCFVLSYEVYGREFLAKDGVFMFIVVCSIDWGSEYCFCISLYMNE